MVLVDKMSKRNKPIMFNYFQILLLNFVNFFNEKLAIFYEIFNEISRTTFAIRLRDGFLNIGYGYRELAIPVSFT